MNDSYGMSTPPRGRVLTWLRDHSLTTLGLLILVVDSIAGWSGSFIGLHMFAVNRMNLSDSSAWLVPIAIDGSACGLTLMVFRAALQGRSGLFYRVLISLFTGLSSWINWIHIPDALGGRVSAVLCPSAVVLLEALTMEMRHSYEERSGAARPRLHPLRWLVDFHGTWAIKKAWVLAIPLPEHLARVADSTESPTGLGWPGLGDSMESATGRDAGDWRWPPEELEPTREAANSTGSGSVDPTDRPGRATGYELAAAGARGAVPDPRVMPEPAVESGLQTSGESGRWAPGEGGRWVPDPFWPAGEELMWERVASDSGLDRELLAAAVWISDSTRPSPGGAGAVAGRDRIREGVAARGYRVGSTKAKALQETIAAARRSPDDQNEVTRREVGAGDYTDPIASEADWGEPNAGNADVAA